MAHFTLIARINTGDGRFPFVNVQFSKNHRPIPIEGATYYLRPSSGGKRTPIKIGKDVAVAHTALVRMENGRTLECAAESHAAPLHGTPTHLARASLKPRESTSSAASRNRARPIWGIAPLSICSSQVAKKPTSTRSAVTTCSTFCTSCGLVHRERPASPSASQPCSTISSRQWCSSTTAASGSTWREKIGCRKRIGRQP